MSMHERFYSEAALKTLQSLLAGPAAFHGKAQRTLTTSEADYVIVGAGATGCVLANRLSQEFDVALIEAGDSRPNHPGLRGFGDARRMQSSHLDWSYLTEEEPGLHGRQLQWPRGRGVGGSTLINYMIYLRPSRRLLDRWAEEVQDASWRMQALLPHFRRSERNANFGGKFHGRSGEVRVSWPPFGVPLQEAFGNAARCVGFAASMDFDFNGVRREGVAGVYQHTISSGMRWSAADAFLNSACQSKIDIRANSLVTRLLIDGGQAEGIEYISSTGELIHLRARQEVIVCCGAIESPKLLMLSGVGPARELDLCGIQVHAESPMVGRQLSDHPVVQLSYRLREDELRSWDGDIPCGGLLFSSGYGNGSPDIQLHPYRYLKNGRPMLTFGVTLVQPDSRGAICIRSPNPIQQPSMYANYLDQPEDLLRLSSAVRTASQLAETAPLQGRLLGKAIPFRKMHEPYVSDAIRCSLDTLFHPSGSCRMGTDPATSVVGSDLKVHGIGRLRVADASIFPTPLDSNPQAMCFAVGEKLAAHILLQRSALRGAKRH